MFTNPLIAAEDRPDVITIHLSDPLNCKPLRSRKSGGRYHKHPCWLDIVTGPVSPGPNLTSWSLTGIRSNPTAGPIQHGGKKSRFSFLSQKSGRRQTGESHHEYLSAIVKEVDPQVVDFQLQGFELHWDADGSPKRYRADSVALDVEGRVIVEEVKASASYFAEPQYRSLMHRVEQDLTHCGIDFRKVTGDQLREHPRRVFNITRAFNERFTAYEPQHVDRVREIFAKNNGETTMGRMTELFGGDPRRSLPLVNALLCARHLAYDLDHQITHDTRVFMPAAPASSPRDIRAL
jgi:hypothetical protein